jgi:hypothetical protein
MDSYVLPLLCLAAFVPVLLVVGGGGLIQTSYGTYFITSLPVLTVIENFKVPAFSGTSLRLILIKK